MGDGEWAERIDGQFEHLLGEMANEARADYGSLAATLAQRSLWHPEAYHRTVLFHEFMNQCGSPIEAALVGSLAAVVQSAYYYAPAVALYAPATTPSPLDPCIAPWVSLSDGSRHSAPEDLLAVRDEVVSIQPQTRAGRYTLDAAVRHFGSRHVFNESDPKLRAAFDAKFAIEADGHAYHERTKEQAAHDRRRDRVLQEHGWMVLRFTGSEIWADTVGCALQVVRALESVVDQAADAVGGRNMFGAAA
jgi:hypothetical protein